MWFRPSIKTQSSKKTKKLKMLKLQPSKYSYKAKMKRLPPSIKTLKIIKNNWMHSYITVEAIIQIILCKIPLILLLRGTKNLNQNWNPIKSSHLIDCRIIKRSRIKVCSHNQPTHHYSQNLLEIRYSLPSLKSLCKTPSVPLKKNRGNIWISY